MKGKMITLLTFTVLIISLFSGTSLAAMDSVDPIIRENDCNPNEHLDSVELFLITEEEFEQLLREKSINNMQPQIETCCDGYPALTWRHRSTRHIYPQGGGWCLGLAYFGDQYCTKYGSVWQSNVCYKQTSTGCGRYHR